MSLYWTTSSLCGLVQNLILLSPKVRRTCGIPATSSQREKPYTHIKNSFKEKYSFKPKNI